jgi:hypothetical protein
MSRNSCRQIAGTVRERALFPNSTLADLYDLNTMPRLLPSPRRTARSTAP